MDQCSRETHPARPSARAKLPPPKSSRRHHHRFPRRSKKSKQHQSIPTHSHLRRAIKHDAPSAIRLLSNSHTQTLDMSFLFGGKPQLSSEQKIAQAEAEIDMVSDMYSR